MAILYTLSKIKDKYNLTVSQDTAYVVKFISNIEETIATEEVIENSTTILSLSKDGIYRLELSVEGEDTVTEEFTVSFNLENSIITDTLYALCNLGCTTTLTSSYLRDDVRSIIENQNLSTKLTTYQSLYLPSHYLGEFSKYIKESVNTYKTLVEAYINKLMLQECIGGCDEYDKTINKLYTYIYWAGLYFTEILFLENAADTESLEFLQSKYKVVEINNCISSCNFDFTTLETIFNNNVNYMNIFQHQLSFIGQGIEDLVDQEFYTNSYTQSQMLTGVAVTFSNIAKFGFIVKGASKNPYKIVDLLGNNITDSFDYYYLDNISYYLSKENVSYSTISFKFQKNN